MGNEFVPKIDFDWFENHLLNEILPVWFEKSVTAEGLFLPHFDSRWSRVEENYGTLVSQTRLIYNFYKGQELTGDEKYLQVAGAGTRFLLEYFQDRKFGGYFYSCDKQGHIVDTRKDSYGHAFVIFALAHAARATGDPQFKQAAIEAWEIVQSKFFDEYGGLYVKFSRDYQEHYGRRWQNSSMHLFEALLTLSELDGMHHIMGNAETIADFILKRLVRAGDHILPEYFDDEWQELSQADGGQILIGHLFEWAFLLSTAVAKGLPTRYLQHAKRFLDAGLELGYDSEFGGIFSYATPDGRVQRTKGWWEQCEAIRALMHFWLVRKYDEYAGPLLTTIEFTKKNMIDKDNLGWYTFLGPGHEPSTQKKGMPGKVYYHVVGMCSEAIRLRSTYEFSA